MIRRCEDCSSCEWDNSTGYGKDDGPHITKEKPHFVSDGPPGIHRRLSHGSKKYLVELHEKFDGHKSLNDMSHSASSLHDQLHYFAEPGSKHYVPEWKRRREDMLKRFEERLEQEEEEEEKKQTVIENSDSFDKHEIAKYVRQRQEAKFMLGIKLMERNAIEKSRHVHERRVHNLLLDIADSEKNNETGSTTPMRSIEMSPKKSIEQVSPKMSQHKPRVELHGHKVISPHQHKVISPHQAETTGECIYSSVRAFEKVLGCRNKRFV